MHGSIAEAIFRRSGISTLFVPRDVRGFINKMTGDFRLRRVLVPLDHTPLPYRAIEAARSLPLFLTSADISMHLLHVGGRAPALLDAATPIAVRRGNVVDTIVDEAVKRDVDFICMATSGHHGVLDAIRGSTTERVIRHAPCPVLAIPAV
jgi:nucleotide-binding universal stress UspA family protein